LALQELPLLQTPTIVLNTTGSVVLGSGIFPITLTATLNNYPSIILDYGENVGGFPWYDISAISSSPLTIKVSYSETLDAVGSGDMDFHPAIHAFDLNRVNVHTITSIGRFDTSAIQGSQRYQRVQLMTAGSITFTSIGFESAFYTPTSGPGSFASSSDLYNKLWQMGTRTLQLNMIPARTVQPGFLATDQGLYMSPGQAGVFLKGMQWINYNVSFSTFVMKKGMTFSIRANDYSEVAVVLNCNNADPSNMVQVLARQELDPTETVTFNTSIPFDFSENTWYNVFAYVNQLNLIVQINNMSVFNIQLPQSSNPYIPSVTPGGVGFSTYKTQSAFIKNIQVIDTTGTILYQDPLTSKKAAHDFGVGSNELSLILDGAKRDRNVWAADLLVAGPTLYYSYYANEYASGSLALCMSYQLSTGPVSSRVGTGFPYQRGDTSNEFVTPIFYSYTYFLATVNTVEDYYMYSGDIEFVKSHWSRLRLLIDSFASLASSDGLISPSNFNWAYDFFPSAGLFLGKFTKLNIQYSMALESIANLAEAINLSSLATSYRTKASSIRNLVNEQLFNSTSGMYLISDQKSGVAQDTNAFAILSGIASLRGDNYPSILLEKMKASLKSNSAYLTFSPDTSISSFVSPFISYFHSAAAFESNRADLAFDVMQSVWNSMSTEDSHYTGTFWENEEVIGYPSKTQSFAHAWSSGITPLLSKYVLGIKPTTPGYAQWSVKPQTGPLLWAKGQTQTPTGILGVSWNVTGGVFSITVQSPPKTTGVIVLPSKVSCVYVNSVKYNEGSVSSNGIGSISRTASTVTIQITGVGTFDVQVPIACPTAATTIPIVYKSTTATNSTVANRGEKIPIGMSFFLVLSTILLNLV